MPLASISQDITLAKTILDGNGLVAIPTETVYGLAAKGTSKLALGKIYEAKNRPGNNPLILHFDSLASAGPFVKHITEDARLLAEEFWPGPLTLLLPKTDIVPTMVTAGSARVAVRVPAHSLTLELLRHLDYPLAAPSANPSGYISPTRPEHVQSQLGDKIPLILDGGPCSKGIESTILGWENGHPVIYRKGAITEAQIAETLGKSPKNNKDTSVLQAPGMSSSHYAPRTLTKIVRHAGEVNGLHSHKKIGLITFNKPSGLNVAHEVILSPKGSISEMAQKLYAAMHELDRMELDLICIEKAPETGIGKAINDRLERSSSFGS